MLSLLIQNVLKIKYANLERRKKLREITGKQITDAIKKLVIEANYKLDDALIKKFKEFIEKEKSETGKRILEQIIENAEIAKDGVYPLCQDTGASVIFAYVGEEIIFKGNGNGESILVSAINKGISESYIEEYLRKSIVRDPFDRVNTKNNTPAMIVTEIVPGDKMKLVYMTKGGGCENMSLLKVLAPAAGLEGVKQFVVETVENAHANPCPPVFVGVGVGGNFEKCAYLAKKALMRGIDEKNPNPFYAEMEEDLLERINKTGVGPQGFGGTTTAIAVHVETFPCHIASLPVAVNIDCHSHRHKEIIL